MTLYEKIKQIYPELTNKDFVETIFLQDDSDGKGAYIARWTHPNFPQPTNEQLGI